eukprot:CAMPEP_0198229322 /NCGR_PEP_ID=MMETSP1445-20131203/114064_1 /TAXON_ID=36898 /ORGANISM="Pyramimonas sp., Strain CCMP2087" /LENGTH=588 /DNA_ID=CAMNT_0043909779 /DNA_START=225 /DNA_END=1991 /DNA_ORIENTATION=+
MNYSRRVPSPPRRYPSPFQTRAAGGLSSSTGAYTSPYVSQIPLSQSEYRSPYSGLARPTSSTFTSGKPTNFYPGSPSRSADPAGRETASSGRNFTTNPFSDARDARSSPNPGAQHPTQSQWSRYPSKTPQQHDNGAQATSSSGYNQKLRDAYQSPFADRPGYPQAPYSAQATSSSGYSQKLRDAYQSPFADRPQASFLSPCHSDFNPSMQLPTGTGPSPTGAAYEYRGLGGGVFDPTARSPLASNSYSSAFQPSYASYSPSAHYPSYPQTYTQQHPHSPYQSHSQYQPYDQGQTPRRYASDAFIARSSSRPNSSGSAEFDPRTSASRSSEARYPPAGADTMRRPGASSYGPANTGATNYASPNPHTRSPPPEPHTRSSPYPEPHTRSSPYPEPHTWRPHSEPTPQSPFHANSAYTQGNGSSHQQPQPQSSSSDTSDSHRSHPDSRLDRRHSMKSVNALTKLTQYEEKLDGILSQLEGTDAALREGRLLGWEALAKAKAAIMQLSTTLEKLQLMGVDGVTVGELESGRDEARALRKQLNKKIESTFPRMVDLMKELAGNMQECAEPRSLLESETETSDIETKTAAIALA